MRVRDVVQPVGAKVCIDHEAQCYPQPLYEREAGAVRKDEALVAVAREDRPSGRLVDQGDRLYVGHSTGMQLLPQAVGDLPPETLGPRQVAVVGTRAV